MSLLNGHVIRVLDYQSSKQKSIFLLSRLMKTVPGTPKNLGDKSNMSTYSYLEALRQVNANP